MANLLNPLLLAQDVTAEFFNDSIDNMRSVAYQTADVTVNNTATVFTASPDLTLPIESGASYIFESCLFFDTSAAADIANGNASGPRPMPSIVNSFSSRLR